MSDLITSGDNANLFNASVRKQIQDWILKFPPEHQQSAIIPALTILQDANGGWLSDELLLAAAQYLNMPKIAVYEVATFYSMFDLKPVGRHKIGVCTNISCLLNGAEGILEHVCKRLQVQPGETSADGRFTVKEVECLGACVGAPMFQLDKQYHEHLTPEKVDQILDGILS